MRDSITVTLEEGDFIDAFRPAPRPKRVSHLLLLLALALTLLIIVLLIRFPEVQTALLASPITMALVGAVVLAATVVAALLVGAPSLRRRAARNSLATTRAYAIRFAIRSMRSAFRCGPRTPRRSFHGPSCGTGARASV